MKTNKVVILDSSALIAQINLTDSLHERTQAIDDFLAEIGRSVILPSEVFAETMNIFGKKVGKREAAQAGKALLARHMSGTLTIVPSTETVLTDALNRLQQSRGDNPSFIDCLVMSFADNHQTKEIYGFDETFPKNGYRLPGAVIEEQVA